MKKSSILIILAVCLLITSGCTNTAETNIKSNGETINITKMQHKHCTRTATAASGIDVSLNYDLYYTGEDLNIIHSVEKVITTNVEDLDTYENAYKGIQAHYEGLEYYDAEVIRNDTSVTSDITINYDKINISKLLEIEGTEDNIIENGKAKVDAWITLAKKLGTTCEDVE